MAATCALRLESPLQGRFVQAMTTASLSLREDGGAHGSSCRPRCFCSPRSAPRTFSARRPSPPSATRSSSAGLKLPTAVAFSPDGRVFVAEKRGTIKVFSSLTATTPNDLRGPADEGLQLLGPGPARAGPAPEFPGDPLRLRALHLRRADRRNGPALGPGRRHDRSLPDSAGSNGRRLCGQRPALATAGLRRRDGRDRAGSHRGLVPAVSEPFDRQHRLRPRRRALRDRRRRSELQLCRLRAGRESPESGRRPARRSRRHPDAADGGGRGAAVAGPAITVHADGSRTAGRHPDSDRSRTPARACRTIRSSPIPTRTRSGSSPTACATPSASRSDRARTRSGSGTSAGIPGKRSTGCRRHRVSPTSAGPVTKGSGRKSSYDNLNLNICENLYAQTGAVTPPYYTYNHSAKIVPGETCSTGSSSISGIAFYTGSAYPSAYQNALFFADYSRQCIWTMLPGRERGSGSFEDPDLRRGRDSPVQLTIGPGGDLFYVDIIGGKIHRIQYFVPNAVISADPDERARSSRGQLQRQRLDAPRSDRHALLLLGPERRRRSSATRRRRRRATPSPSPGSHTVTLRVTDTHGGVDTETVVIDVDNALRFR